MAETPKVSDALLEYHGLNQAPLKRTPRFLSFQQQYRDDRVAFVHDCFTWPEGQFPAEYQDEIVGRMDVVNREAVRGPHGLGKSAMAAWLIWHFGLTMDGLDWKAPTTASSWRQLIKYLWPEIHKWSRRLRYDILGRTKFDPLRELMSQNLKLKTGEALALASDQPESMEGCHADNLFFMFDEAKAIVPATWDAIEGAFSTTGMIKVLAISTPGAPIGRFYDIHKRKPGYEDWEVRHVTVDEAIKAGRISAEWVEQRRKQWGQDSAVFKNRVLGEFANQDETGVIPLAWIEKAIEYWHELNEMDTGGESDPFGEFTCLGVDVARGGGDNTIHARGHGDHAIKSIEYRDNKDTMETAGEVVGVIRNGGRAVIDVAGVGAGVFDRVREQDFEVVAFNSSGKTAGTDKSGELMFINIRAEAWWQLRERLDPTSGLKTALPPDERMTGDLTAPKWHINSSGRIQIESKDEIRKRLGRSPDAGDAVVMRFYNQEDKEIDFY